MSIVHDSQRIFFRSPFGACTCNTPITLRLQVSEPKAIEQVYLRLWQDSHGERKLPMKWSGNAYELSFILPEKPTVLWYYFILELADETVYYGNNARGLGGLGCLSSKPPASYQITVYQLAKVPEWFKKAVMYQIFPDRFYRSESWSLHCRPGSLYHPCWEDMPFYVRDPETKDVVAYDFFGGNLTGIREKLPYLCDLGITLIYLNPVFQSVSNHRYDVSDYENIEPMLGDNDVFRALCREAKTYGMEIILDGVFSHTARESLYFQSACQSVNSPYYSWYRFSDYPNDYECWWGIKTMPNVEELEPGYLDFMIEGKDSVVRQWLRCGAKGWRLDVADELPDEFIKKLRRAVKQEDKEAVLLGEVWEDASNKKSYDVLREYFLGQELDSVMNYPWRKAVLAFVLEQITAYEVHEILLSLYENYPRENFYALMNLLGSHDRERILTVLGEPENITTDQQKLHYTLPPEALRTARQRLKLLVVWQMTFPGVPSVYYGDEAGLQGFSDPYNRRTYPWGNEDQELLDWHKTWIRLRKEHDLFCTGEWLSLPVEQDVYGYIRRIADGKDCFGAKAADGAALVLLNRSRKSKRVKCLVRGIFYGILKDVLDGSEFLVKQGCVEVELPPLTARVLLQVPKVDFQHHAGVLLHLTSLPGEYGIGDLGGAYGFIDFLAESGLKYWQILPINPTGLGESPYQTYSAFAGNHLLIDLAALVDLKLLKAEEIEDKPDFPLFKVDYELLKPWKEALLYKAYRVFMQQPKTKSYRDFMAEASAWLPDYALFRALAEYFSPLPWSKWPRDIAERRKEALERWTEKLRDRIEYHYFVQYVFFSQWDKLKKYAVKKNVAIIGDIPIFVAYDSVDVWCHPEWFDLNPDGTMHTVAGVPPDYFSKTGQLWGNPLYCWEKMRENDYWWWRQRLAWLLKLTDVIRIDHFRGFASFWSIKANAETAVNGEWLAGPGSDFFQIIKNYLGEFSLIVEDLGIITDDVVDLRDELAFPGIQVLQFILTEKPLSCRKNSVLYSGTHDNDTLLGWYTQLSAEERLKVNSNVEINDKEDALNQLLAKVWGSSADLVIFPLQDLLKLDNRARMNLPGTVGNNWIWRFKREEITRKLICDIQNLIKKYAR